MTRHEFLRALHAVARPRNYLEIGVDTGASLSLSRVPSIGIDPAFNVTRQIRCDVQLVRATSDDFFARDDPLHHLRSGRNPFRNLRRGRPPLAHYIGDTALDLAFIDGMHLVEYALRDFMNVERFSRWSTPIVIDDMLPPRAEEAARERLASAWTGDVYKLIGILRQHRPDLTVLPLKTRRTGVVVVFGADAKNTVLRDRYEAIVATAVSPDPQVVPAAILERQGAMEPERLLEAKFWPWLVRTRTLRTGRSRGYERLRRELAALTG
jgi:hypothetical protein